MKGSKFIECARIARDYLLPPPPVLTVRPGFPAVPTPIPPLFSDCFQLLISGSIVSSQPYEPLFKEAKKHDQVLIVMDCPGGDATSSMEIFNAIRDLVMDPSKDVRALVANRCYSAAVTILMAIPPQKRYGSSELPPKFMIHGSMLDNGQKENQSPIAKELNEGFVIRPLVWGSALSEESLRLAMKSGLNYFFDAHEAIYYGLISAMV